MRAYRSRFLQFVRLRTAAMTTYLQLTGESPDPGDLLRMQELLNEVAHAIAKLTTIYAIDPVTQMPEALDDTLVNAGRFLRGGGVLLLPDGRTYGDLHVERGDWEMAIAILRGAGIWKRHQDHHR